MPETPTGHELLVRIDERVKAMSVNVHELCVQVNKKVSNDDDYQDIVKKVNNLWDMKNRMIGVMLGSGVVGGTLPLLVQTLIKAVSAHF